MCGINEGILGGGVVEEEYLIIYQGSIVLREIKRDVHILR